MNNREKRSAEEGNEILQEGKALTTPDSFAAAICSLRAFAVT